MIQQSRQTPRPSRRAMLTLSVLVSMAVVMALYMAWARMLVLERQQASAELDRVQAEYLAVSAVERAARQLQLDPNYQGETWRIEPSAVELPGGAATEIRVESVEGQSRRRRVTVDAQFPERGSHRVRQRQQTIITLNEPGDAS
jgi:cell division protein FtsL